MEELLYFLVLGIVYWRGSVTTVGGAIVALAFVHYVPGFSPLQGIAFLVIGILLGTVWHEKKRFNLVSTARTTTAQPVLIFAAFLGGAVWGFFSSETCRYRES